MGWVVEGIISSPREWRKVFIMSIGIQAKTRENAGGAWEGSHRGKASAEALGLEARPVGGAGGARGLGTQDGQG